MPTQVKRQCTYSYQILKESDGEAEFARECRRVAEAGAREQRLREEALVWHEALGLLSRLLSKMQADEDVQVHTMETTDD